MPPARRTCAAPATVSKCRPSQQDANDKLSLTTTVLDIAGMGRWDRHTCQPGYRPEQVEVCERGCWRSEWPRPSSIAILSFPLLFNLANGDLGRLQITY